MLLAKSIILIQLQERCKVGGLVARLDFFVTEEINPKEDRGSSSRVCVYLPSSSAPSSQTPPALGAATPLPLSRCRAAPSRPLPNRHWPHNPHRLAGALPRGHPPRSRHAVLRDPRPCNERLEAPLAIDRSSDTHAPLTPASPSSSRNLYPETVILLTTWSGRQR